MMLMSDYELLDPESPFCYGMGLYELRKEEDKNMDVNGMTKEQALEAIEKLKAYIEECDKKEIPKMLITSSESARCEIKAGYGSIFSCYLDFKTQDSKNIWAILSIELAHLLYCREYLKVTDIRADEDADDVYRLMFSVHEGKYKVHHYGCVDPCEDEIPWFFTKRDDAERVQDYMNKHVSKIKKEMY